MKSVVGGAILSAVMLFLLGACASQETAGPQYSQPATSVPGESRDGGEITPGVGPSGASANVRW